MRLHELHPSLVHAPLVLLPAAAVTDLAAVLARGRLRRLAFDAAGRRLWWAGVASAAAAGIAGMAASQEVEARDEAARDALWLHGVGNVGILLAAVGLASWRSAHRASPLTAGLGAASIAAATYTAWLGGEIVYTHGVGVEPARSGASFGAPQSPPLLSREAPLRLLSDAARGLSWLLGRAARLATGKEPLARGAPAARTERQSDAGAQYTPSSSTSNTSVALGGISGGAPLAP